MRDPAKQDEINQEIEELLNAEERLKDFDAKQFEAMLDKWTADFKIEQPSQFFRDHPTNDAELVCSTQDGKSFLLHTLRFFGLPKGYMEKEGHFPDWGKKRLEEKKRGPKTKKEKKKMSKALSMAKKKLGRDKKDDSDVKPTYFDITVFQKCFKRFSLCDGEQRSAARKLLLRDLNKSA